MNKPLLFSNVNQRGPQTVLDQVLDLASRIHFLPNPHTLRLRSLSCPFERDEAFTTIMSVVQGGTPPLAQNRSIRSDLAIRKPLMVQG